MKIAFGTDAGPFPHGTQAIKFEWMTRYGMSPLDAIHSATINAVDANPLDDIRQLEHVKFVMKGGQIIRNDTAK